MIGRFNNFVAKRDLNWSNKQKKKNSEKFNPAWPKVMNTKMDFTSILIKYYFKRPKKHIYDRPCE